MINIILCEIIDVAIPLASHTRENTGDTLRGFSRKSYADVYSYNYKTLHFQQCYYTVYIVRCIVYDWDIKTVYESCPCAVNHYKLDISRIILLFFLLFTRNLQSMPFISSFPFVYINPYFINTSMDFTDLWWCVFH